MWAQLIKMQLKPDNDTAVLDQQLRAAEQPGSGLVRTLVMHDQKDPSPGGRQSPRAVMRRRVACR